MIEYVWHFSYKSCRTPTNPKTSKGALEITVENTAIGKLITDLLLRDEKTEVDQKRKNQAEFVD